MNRRGFLIRTGKSAAAVSLFSMGGTGCFSRNDKPGHPQSSKANLDTLITSLDQNVPAWLEEFTIPGASIALVQNAKNVWAHGFGVKNVETKEPVTTSTMFEAASMSKPVFAYRVLKLCEKGILNLDRPLTNYTSRWFLENEPLLDEVTARHILSHTGGFQNWRSGDKPLKIHFKPGEKWMYSGEGYFYLQNIVSQLTGQIDESECSTYEAGVKVCATDFDPAMRRNVLEPLGMRSSGYLWTDEAAREMARPHNDKGRPRTQKKFRRPDVARHGAAGGMLTTPSDYAKFLIAFMTPPAPNDFLLTKRSLGEMLRPQISLDDPKYKSSWALGWKIFHNEHGDYFSHGGANSGFQCFSIASVSRKTGLVAMTNSDNGPKLLEKLLFAPETQSFL